MILLRITALWLCLLVAHQTPAQSSRFFTTTGVSLAFPAPNLRTVAGNGRGTSFTMEYAVTPSTSVVVGWDSNTFPVQSSALSAGLGPGFTNSPGLVKGDYLTNAFGLYGVRYITQRRVRPYGVAGVGLNVITQPTPVFDAQTQVLTLASANQLRAFGMVGLGAAWQFSKPVAAFGEANVYWTPAPSLVATMNTYWTLKIGLRFPLF